MVEIELDVGFDKDQLDKVFFELEDIVESASIGIAIELFNNILNRSPQWSGSYVASWSISLNEPKFVDRSAQALALSKVRFDIDADPEERQQAPFSRGSVEPINIALREASGIKQSFTLGDTIYISNGVISRDPGFEDYHYGPDIESSMAELRAANRPGEAVRRSINYVMKRYGDITQNDVIKLKMKTL